MPHELFYYIIHAIYVALTLYLEKYKFYTRLYGNTKYLSILTQTQFEHLILFTGNSWI